MIDTKTVLENKTDGYLAEDSQVKGGWLTVQTLEERDAILSVALKVGSLCYCTADSKFYIYDGSTWSEKQMGGGSSGRSIRKYIGQIIRSKTLDTEAKVIARYGGLYWKLIGDEDGVYQWKRTDEYPGLCFIAEEANATVGYRKNGSLPDIHIQKSNNGTSWEDWDGSAITLTNIGDKVYVRNLSNALSTGSGNYFNFYTMNSRKIKASGDISSMINFAPLSEYCYEHMFGGCTTSLVQAPELPATQLADYCYTGMFSGCSSLTIAPELPATELAPYCYGQMFYDCTSLTQTPELPATTLARYCYFSMFQGCTSLTQTPELPATELANNCYTQMFYGCTALTQAPQLSATQLTEHCYSQMFYGCTALTEAPQLPATQLAPLCYFRMFEGCTSLKISQDSGDYKFFTCPDTTPSGCVEDMFDGTGGTYTSDPVAGHDYYYND